MKWDNLSEKRERESTLSCVQNLQTDPPAGRLSIYNRGAVLSGWSGKEMESTVNQAMQFNVPERKTLKCFHSFVFLFTFISYRIKM